MVGFDADESHGTIRKKSPKQEIQVYTSGPAHSHCNKWI